MMKMGSLGFNNGHIDSNSFDLLRCQMIIKRCTFFNKHKLFYYTRAKRNMLLYAAFHQIALDGPGMVGLRLNDQVSMRRGSLASSFARTSLNTRSSGVRTKRFRKNPEDKVFRGQTRQQKTN